MLIVFPLVTFMDYGQIKYFKVELKLFPSLFLNNYLIPYNYKRRHYEMSVFLEKTTFVTIFSIPENASNLRRFSDALSLISKVFDTLHSHNSLYTLHSLHSLHSLYTLHSLHSISFLLLILL